MTSADPHSLADFRADVYIPPVSVHLTSAVPGSRKRRQVRAISFHFQHVDVRRFLEWDCWPAIDAQLATLPHLCTVLIET